MRTSLSSGVNLKKIRWISALLVVIVFVGFALAMKRSPNHDNLPSLRPYVAKEKTIYYDPAQLMKSMLVSMPAGYKPPASEMQPVMVHVMKISNISWDDLSRRIHQDLNAKNGWNFEPWPPPGMGKVLSSGSFDLKMIIAYQGKPGSYATLFSGAGMPGGKTPDHVITVMPDFTASMKMTDPTAAFKSPKTFMIMEQKKLSTWEVDWLKVKNLGKSPFSSQKDFMNMSDF